MDEIEGADRARAHAVGELGRLDPAYQRVERVRAQAKSIQDAAAKSETVLEKVRESVASSCVLSFFWRVRSAELTAALCACMCVCVRVCVGSALHNFLHKGQRRGWEQRCCCLG
jgi:hypothetical protein